MAVDVTELEKRAFSMIAQDPDGPTEGDDDWNLILKFLNMSQREWQESYQWPQLYKEVYTLSSSSTANATLTLPSDFRKFDGYLTICDETNTTSEYPQIDPVKRTQYDETEKYFYILGDPSNGYNAVINPGTHGTGASINYSYWAEAASLCSPTDKSMCPDPAYLVQKTVAYWWESLNDGRFQSAKADADMILARMLEFEQSRGHSYYDRVQTYEDRLGYRIGRD